MWCDSFDADLLKVVPGAAVALGDTEGLELSTYSNPTDGKINCPSEWSTEDGFTAFFWTNPDRKPPQVYYTTAPVTGCTFLEAVRDEWVHHAILNVNGTEIWRPPVRLFERLMYDVRGWTALGEGTRGDIRTEVIAGLTAAADRLRRAAR